MQYISRIFCLALIAILIPQLVSAAQTVEVGMVDNAYLSQGLTVVQGDTVRWTNNGKMPHTVTADNGNFNSNNIAPGSSFQWTFNTPGVYRYYCALHGAAGGYGMTATVAVIPPQTPVNQTVSLTQGSQTTSTGNAAADALRAQIVQLLSRIEALQKQYGGGGTVSAPPAYVPSGAPQCPLISRSLKRGAQGEDVARLQRFLALDPSVYPEAQVTGYYGALTEAAVKRFQCKNKLVCDGSPEGSGFGVTGPRTAALLALQCPDMAGNVGGFLKVTPLSGPAPLNATIEVIVNASKSCSAATYEIDYGDGTPKTIINVPPNYCNEMRQLLNHTFTMNGTFQVTLRSGIHQISSTVTVSGTGVPSGVDSVTASPRSGTAPLSVKFQGLVNAQNACNATYTLNFGDGTSTSLPASGCVASTFTVTHVYGGGGNFIARLTRDAGNVEVGTVSVSVTPGGGQYGEYFSISPGTEGDVFKVTADFELESSCAAYTLDWGDGSAQASQSQGTCNLNTVKKQLTHTYTNTGQYTITLKRGSNLDKIQTAGITISN